MPATPSTPLPAKPKPLTDTALRNLKNPSQRIEKPDGQVHGLVVRVTPSGTKTWTLAYRVRGQGEVMPGGKRAAGPKRRLTLGEFPAVGVADARATATRVLAEARRGIDPEASRKAVAIKQLTVGDLIDRYVKQWLLRNLRSGAMVEQLLRAHVEPVWGGRPIAEIRRGDLVALLERVRVKSEIVDPKTGGRRSHGGPVAAANVRKWVAAMWKWAVAQDIVADSVMVGVADPDKQRPRSRNLTIEELRAVWAATKALTSPWRELYQLLILTGQRRNEWASARWDWIDADVTRLLIPADQYKSDRPQVVPLSRQAKEIVKSITRHGNGPYLITTDGGKTPVSGFSKAKEKLDEKVGVGGVRVAEFSVHDLRRTMATQMERLNIEPHIIESTLGHALKGIEGVYRHFNYYDRKADALQRWADEVTGPDR